MKIFIDADFLVALNKKDDSNFKKAIQKSHLLKTAQVFITPLTLPEAVTVLSYKISQDSACMFLKQARASQFNIVPFDDILISKSDQIFLAQKTKGTSWIDCLNVAAIQIHGLDGILSFDRFYKKMGIKIF